MRADDGVRIRRNGPIERSQRIRRVEQLPPDGCDVRADVMQRAQHGVVFKAGDHRTSAGLYKRFDRQIQRVGGVHGEYNLLRLRTKERADQAAAVIDRVGRTHGRRMPAAPRCRHAAHGALHRKGDRRRLLERSRPGIEIDHSCACSRKPFGWTR